MPWNGNAYVVVCPSLCHSSGLSALEEYLTSGPAEPGVKQKAFALGETAKLVSPSLPLRNGDDRFQCQGVCPGPLGVGKYVQIGDIQLFNELHRLLKQLLGLPGMPGDDVSPDTGVGKSIPYTLYPLPVEFTAVATAHQTQHTV